VEHSALGSANTQLGVQRERPSLFDLVEDMKRLSVPTLVLSGDEDWPCLLPGILMSSHRQNFMLSEDLGDDENRRPVSTILDRADLGWDRTLLWTGWRLHWTRECTPNERRPETAFIATG
jgi:hypothetical protein